MLFNRFLICVTNFQKKFFFCSDNLLGKSLHFQKYKNEKQGLHKYHDFTLYIIFIFSEIRDFNNFCDDLPKKVFFVVTFPV